MKFQVKTTALAILVSLGVVACKSNDTTQVQDTKPTPVNPQPATDDAEKKAQEEARKKAEADAKAEAEAKAKAEEAKRLEDERKKAEADAKARAEAESKAKAEEEKRLEEERKKAEAEKAAEEERKKAEAEKAEKLKPVNLLDKNGVEWRIINIRDKGPRNNTTEYLYNGYANEIYTGYMNEPTSFFRLEGVNGATNLKINELSTKDGKPFLGVHQGTITDPDFSGKKITKLVEADNSRAFLKVAETEDAKEFNYLYVNQPYSTYGAIFTNAHTVKFFAVAQKADHQIDPDVYGVYKDEEVVRDGKSLRTGKIIWNDAVAGDAVYKGQVIANVARAYMDKFSYGARSTPELDGTVTLNVRFDKDPERNSISGEIDSKQIGKITLEKSYGGLISRSGLVSNETMAVKNNHSSYDGYDVKFFGKDLNDAVGRVSIAKPNVYVKQGDVVRYDAVFGATKQ